VVEWVGFVINLILGTIVLHVAAKLVKIDDATLMKAFLVALIAAVLGLVLGYAGVIGALLALVIAIALIKFIYDVSWGKAIFAWIIYFILMIIIGIIVGLIGFATFFALS
jgi:hypothetical protein